MSVNLTQTFQVAATGNGNGTAAGCNGLAAYSMDVQLGGGGAATINFEGQCDDLGGATLTWRAVAATPIGGGADVTTAAADGTWILKCAGLSQVRARISGYSSGTIYVQGYGSYVPRW